MSSASVSAAAIRKRLMWWCCDLPLQPRVPALPISANGLAKLQIFGGRECSLWITELAGKHRSWTDSNSSWRRLSSRPPSKDETALGNYPGSNIEDSGTAVCRTRSYEATSIRTLAAKAHVNQAAITRPFLISTGQAPNLCFLCLVRRDFRLQDRVFFKTGRY